MASKEKIDTSIDGLTKVFTPKKKAQKQSTSPVSIKSVKTVQIRQVNVQKLPSNQPPIESPNESESLGSESDEKIGQLSDEKSDDETKNTPFDLELIPISKKKHTPVELERKPDASLESIIEQAFAKNKDVNKEEKKGHLEKNGDGYYVEDEEDLDQIEGLNHKGLWNKLLEICRRIYREMGTGHTESIYHNAFEIELRNHQISYESEKKILITYQDLLHGRTYTLGEERVDLFLLDYNLIIELKSLTNQPKEIELSQIRKYYRELLKAGNHMEEWGLVINFPQPGPTKKSRDLVDFVIVRL
jgi:GxxExxY protein